MTSQPFQPGSSAASYDEGDLLALVEGLPLPAERAARVREALANNPQLAELVAVLRADRDAIASLPTVTASAPADLLDRVEAQLERDALVGLARSETYTAEQAIPVSTILPPRRVLIGPRLAGVMAAAAAVALIAGGVLMMVPGKRAKIAPPDGGLAADTHGSTETTLANAQTGVVGPLPDTAPADHHPDIATDTSKGPADSGTPAVANADATQPTAAATGPSMEQLLAAAQEGRLMLRLRTDEKTARGRVDDLNAHARVIRVQALGADRSSVFVGALADAMRPRPATPFVKPTTPDTQPAFASDNNPSKIARPGPSVAQPEQPQNTNLPAPEFASQSFVASLPAAAESLEALRKAMATVGGDWQILPHGVHVEPPTDTASILWWTAPTSEWGPRLTIPVVVQTN